MSRTSERSSHEHGLIEVARRAWGEALTDFYHPPLPEPIIENTTDASSFFYIDSDSWTVHLNTVGVPLYMDANEAEPYLRSVCHHEIQHYLLCPFDGVTNGLMFAAARKKVNDATAMFVCNLFADLVVDSKLLKRFPALTHSRINASIHDSALRVRDHSILWNLIAATYRAMWGFPIPATASVDERTFEAAKKITDVARKTIDNESKWPKACEVIAKIIAEWLPDDDRDQLPGMSDFGSSSETRGEGVDAVRNDVLVPLDVDAVMGSPIEVRNGDLARRCLDSDSTQDIDGEMERLAIEVEQLGGNIEDLEGVYLTAGIGSPRKEWIRFWYRAKANGNLRIEVVKQKFSGSAPLTPQVWRLGDPVEELDIVQSLQAFPVLIPNKSTRKWFKVDSQGIERSQSLPDMLIVIDSSGSMTWGMRSKSVSGSYHTALVAAFAAMEVALRKGSRIAAINFSDGSRSSKWSSNREDAERILLAYQGGGTVAPTKKIASACENAESQVMVIMITDAEIANWDKFIDAIRVLTHKGHKSFIFHIGGGSGKRRSKVQRALEDAGASVYPIRSTKDLPSLVIREVRGIYG
ncbi:MAG: vWA domain-containing protein [Candidatus Thorarchaeota archaeon]